MPGFGGAEGLPGERGASERAPRSSEDDSSESERDERDERDERGERGSRLDWGSSSDEQDEKYCCESLRSDICVCCRKKFSRVAGI